MRRLRIPLERYAGLLLGLLSLLALLGLQLTGRFGYLLFHSLAELFSIAIACGMFMVVWNARRFLANDFLLFIATAYLFVAGIDTLHTLAFKGMGVFAEPGANWPTQLWIAARYLQSLSLLAAFVVLGRRVNLLAVFAGYAVVTALVVASIMVWRVFPACYVDGVGLTPFKKISEYIISLILLVTLGRLWWRRSAFERGVWRLLAASVGLTVASELVFTTYLGVYDTANLVGHLLKIAAFYCIYRAIIVTGLTRPYDLLFRDLQQSKQALEHARDDLEYRVQERTAELQAANTQLQRQIMERERAEARFRGLLEGAPDAIIIVDGSGRIILANSATARVFGYLPGELLGKPIEFLIPPRFREHHEQHQAEYAARQFPRLMGDKRQLLGQHKDGREFPVEVSLSPIEVEGGVVVMSAVRDVTARVQTQVALARQTEELRRSNAELEQFAYVASHDLQEPLRMVTSYLQLLEQRYRGRLDADADEFIGYAVDGALRMQQLILDLLAYSRLQTRGQPFGTVDLRCSLEQALANLRITLQETEALVTHDELPAVPGDESQLTQLFQNLVGNALKFRREAPPRVHIGAQAGEREWTISVRDNGIGFAPEYSAQIFQIFQRLHTRAAYPGTGIGLALCKKIVERHGGRIWAESEPGAGSTFYFTLATASQQ
jgi:PAS domain S-box-containing protein